MVGSPAADKRVTRAVLRNRGRTNPALASMMRRAASDASQSPYALSTRASGSLRNRLDPMGLRAPWADYQNASTRPGPIPGPQQSGSRSAQGGRARRPPTHSAASRTKPATRNVIFSKISCRRPGAYPRPGPVPAFPGASPRERRCVKPLLWPAPWRAR